MKPAKSADRVLERLRRLCLSLPEVAEVQAWGHPNFRVGKKTFAVFEFYHRRPCIAVKVEEGLQHVLIDDVRIFRTPYIGHRGWISIWTDGALNWTMVQDLVRGSYKLMAPKKLLVRSTGRSPTRLDR